MKSITSRIQEAVPGKNQEHCKNCLDAMEGVAFSKEERQNMINRSFCIDFMLSDLAKNPDYLKRMREKRLRKEQRKLARV